MFALGLAAVSVFSTLPTGFYGAVKTAASPLFFLLDGTPFLEWIFRALIALFKVALAWPEGVEISAADAIIALFGENIAVRLESFLRAITSIPQIVEVFSDFLKWGQIVLLFGMVAGIITYWQAYTTQAGKSPTMFNKIWGGKTLIVDPFRWGIRLFLVSCVYAIAMRMVQIVVKDIWVGLNWLIDYIYAGQGTTVGQAFETNLKALADTGVIGIIALAVVLLLLFFFTLRMLWAYAKRVFSFLVANFLVMWDIGKYLDGSKLHPISEPLKKYFSSLFLVAGTVLFVFLGPLASARVSEWAVSFTTFGPLVGAFVLLIFLELAADFPRHIEKWQVLRRGKEGLAGFWQNAGSWIDEDYVAARSQESEMSEVHRSAAERAAGWVMEKTPAPVRRVASVGLEIAKRNPEAGPAIAAVAASASVLRNKEARTDAIARSLYGEVGFSWDREEVLAKFVAKREPLFSQLDGLSNDRDYAIFYELTRSLQGPIMERQEIVRRKVEEKIAKLSANEIQQLAAKGRKVAKLARSIRNPDDPTL